MIGLFAYPSQELRLSFLILHRHFQMAAHDPVTSVMPWQHLQGMILPT